jgi:hypothetical protein
MNILKLFEYSYLFFLSLLMVPSVSAKDIGQQPYSFWRVKQPNGLGIGLSLSSTSGLILFYDRNLDEKSQLHLQTSIGRDEAENIFGWEIVTLSRTLIFGTYRRFFSKDKGFYYGIGAGYGGSKLDTRQLPQIIATVPKEMGYLSLEKSVGRGKRTFISTLDFNQHYIYPIVMILMGAKYKPIIITELLLLLICGKILKILSNYPLDLAGFSSLG